MQIPEERGFIERESKVRQMTLRAATALSVLIASLLFFLVVPVFPRELMALTAIGLGILAYKSPTPALILMLLLAVPGYLFQLSSLPGGTILPIPMIAVISVLLVIVAVAASETGGALGVTAGAVAAILILTPLHSLALPVLIGTILFRTRGVQVRAVSAVLIFVILYYPILAITNGTPPGGIVPIFEPVTFHAKPPIPILSMNEISTALGHVVNTPNAGNTQGYMANLADYWPLSLKQRLLPVGFVFCILAGVGMIAMVGMFALFRWLKKRGINHDYLTYATPALSLFAGTIAFFVLANILARPLEFANTLSIPGLLIGTVVVGSFGSFTELWLRRRDRILDMRDDLAAQANAMREKMDFLLERTKTTKEHCGRMDTDKEEALVQMCQQELVFVEQAVTDLSLTDLEEKVVRFQELQAELNESVEESNAKLYQYYDEDRQRYNDSLILAERYGFHLGDSIQGPDFSQLTSLEYDEVLKLQISLNGSYQISARLLAEGVKKLEETLCSEVDADFKRTGIHIARDYFTQERCAEAMQEFLQELGDIERALLGTLTGLDKQVILISNDLKAIVTDVLMPTAVSLGDVISVSYYKQVIGGTESLYAPPVENPTLPDMMRTVASVGELGEIMADLSSKLGQKIVELESIIQGKTPSGHSWGVDSQIQTRMTEISTTFRKPSNHTGIHDSMSLLRSGPSAIESAALAVKDYSIAQELLINYANMEPILEERLHESGAVTFNDLPVKRKYSHNYLKLYCLNHPREVRIEADTGRLTRL